jgi:hypothetical protein
MTNQAPHTNGLESASTTLRWFRQWWWLCIVIGAAVLIVGWKESRCQVDAEQCRAYYTAQDSRRPGLSINSNAAEQEAINAACEPNSYFCRLFSAANLPTWFLVFIGIGATWAALRTLGMIERQTGVLTESQRPRIVAEAAQSPRETFADTDAPRVVLRVTNRGSTPAADYTYESWIEVLPDTAGNFTGAADHFKFGTKSVLYPNSPFTINIPLRNGVNDQDRSEVGKLRKYVCVRLHVEYQDPFIAQRRCHADFGFYIIPNGFGFLSKHNGVGYEDSKET